MRTPDTLNALVDHGIIEEVLRPLMSGKEAQIYLVLSGGEQRVAKIYKEAQNRSFQNRADYTEGRKVRNSRDQRAMGNRSKHGKAQNEAAWKSAEVDMIYRLRDAGVRVPTPHYFIDGVLIMELVTDAEGFPAPRLGDLTYEPEEATQVFNEVMGEVIRMLCAGVVHGDLSDFNVLMSATGPVVIDFPQSVDASSNANAKKLLLRDVDNLHRFHAKWAPAVQALPYGQEMWDLYQRMALTPETVLTGNFRTKHKAVSTEAVLDLIADADQDERKRREGLGLSMRGTTREARPESAPSDTRGRGPRPGAREPRAEAAPRNLDQPRQERPAPRNFNQPRAEAVLRNLNQPRQERPAPRNFNQPRAEAAPRNLNQPRQERPAPRNLGQPRQERPAPRNLNQPRQERPAPRNFNQPRQERPAPRNFNQPRQERPAPRNFDQPRQDRPAPRNFNQPRQDRPAPRNFDQPRQDRPAPRNFDQPRQERPAPQREQQPAPRWPSRDNEQARPREGREAARAQPTARREAPAYQQRTPSGSWGQRNERAPDRTRPVPPPDGPLTSDDGGFRSSRNRDR